MSQERLDLVFAGVFYHAHIYALSSSLSKLLGPAQAVLLGEYALALSKILARGEDEYARLLDTLGAFNKVLKGKNLVKDVKVDELGGNRALLTVEKCALASTIHPSLKLVSSEVVLCPIATMAMVAMAHEKGYEAGENIFDYVKYEKNVSRLSEDGSETVLIVAGK